jgi:hypothetical protein
MRIVTRLLIVAVAVVIAVGGLVLVQRLVPTERRKRNTTTWPTLSTSSWASPPVWLPATPPTARSTTATRTATGDMLKKRKLVNGNLAVMVALVCVAAPIVRTRRNYRCLITQY